MLLFMLRKSDTNKRGLLTPLRKNVKLNHVVSWFKPKQLNDDNIIEILIIANTFQNVNI